MCTPVYSQGLELNTGLTVGYNNPIVARFTVDAATGNVVSFGTITSSGDITCNALTTTNIYTKTETDNLLTPKAATSYVDAQLLLKANLSDMLTALSHKHPTITSATDLTVNNIIANSVEPQAGTTYLQLRTNAVKFGTTLYAPITLTKASFWTPVYISERSRAQ